jgi:hypothetical protein
MELDPEQAGQSVRCVHCAGLVRTPAGQVGPPELPPLAALAAALPVFASRRVLSYVPAWPWRHAHELHVVEIARRLHELATSENDGDRPAGLDGAGGMTNCSYCGSTIAGFLRKCPYCRHALWGV